MGDLFRTGQDCPIWRIDHIGRGGDKACKGIFFAKKERGGERVGVRGAYERISTKSSGRITLANERAWRKSGAISVGSNPAMPHPIRVTRKVSSGCCLANSMNSLTYGAIVSTPPCMVGIANDWPWRPTPWPEIAPKCLRAIRAAPPAWFP